MSIIGEVRRRAAVGLPQCTCSHRQLWRTSQSTSKPLLSSHRRQTTLSPALLFLQPRFASSSSSSPSSPSSSLPRILQPSLWKPFLPTFLIRRLADRENKKSKPWNPATFFIIMSLLIGSQAMNTIALRNDRDTFMRRADQRILALKEVINKVKEGEWAPDGPEVNKRLRRGLSDEPITDEDWEATLREIEEEEQEWQAEAKKRRAIWEQESYEKGLINERKREEKEERELEKRGPRPFDIPDRGDIYRTPPKHERENDRGSKPRPSRPTSAKDYFG